MAEMTHEKCSELLPAYVAGDLAPDGAEAVRAHLAGCGDCRAEEQAVAALAAPAHEPLTDLERGRLHRTLSQELFSPRANEDVATPAPAAAWKRWIAPALGSAAAVLVALLVVTGGLTGGSDEGASTGAADGGGTDASLESSQDAVEPAGGGGSAARGADKPTKDQALSTNAAQAGTAYDGGPQPQFDPDAGPLSAEELSSIGRSSDLFREFADTYTVDDARDLRGSFLRRLASASGASSRQVRECAATLPQDEPILPAYGATGKYGDRDALVLGFVTNDASSSSLDRYLMWVWTKGSCRTPVDTLFERIER